MIYRDYYITPENFDNIILESDDDFLTGLWFENSKDANKHKSSAKIENSEIFKSTKLWLDEYFSGKNPKFTPKFKFTNLTPFKNEVYQLLLQIPFGQTTTYGEIATKIAKTRGLKKMSAQAVGGAVGSNPICLIVPCHRVIGKNGKMVGYGGGLNNKIELLKLEKTQNR
mgnify:CR=1 FL=1